MITKNNIPDFSNTDFIVNGKKYQVKALEMMEFSNEIEGLTFSHEDVEMARNTGYAKGFAEGVELGVTQGELKAIKEIDIVMQEIVMQINNNLNTLIDHEKVFHENFYPSILKVCMIVLQKCMPFFFNENGKQEIEQVLFVLVRSFIKQLPIQIKVSKRVYPYLIERIQDLYDAYSETIEIIEDESFSDNACEVIWDGGGAKWILDDIYQEVQDKIEAYFNKIKSMRG